MFLKDIKNVMLAIKEEGGMLGGTAVEVLVEDDGEHILGPGDAAGWAAGVANGHHVVNRSGADATYLIFGTRAATDRAHYPDIDLAYVRDENGSRFYHKDGTPWEDEV